MKHQDSVNIHVPYNWSYADATARGAATGFVAGDIGKLARQLSDDTLWMLTAITPTWVAIGGVGGGGPAEPPLGNPATDGQVLSSTVAGVRSWIAPAAGGGGVASELWASFDGQGAVVTTGVSLLRPIENTRVLTKAAIVADVSGSVTVTVNKYTPAAGVLGSPTALGTIVLASAQHVRSTGLSWTVTAGDVVEFLLGGTITSVTKVNVVIGV